MRPHPRIRKVVKWGGLAVGSAIVTLMVLTSGSEWAWGWWQPGRARRICACEGVVTYWSFPAPESPRPMVVTPGWQSRRTGAYRIRWWIDRLQVSTGTFAQFPLWMPASASLMLTGTVWYLEIRDLRRARVGLCRACGYDLAGLSGAATCPECGNSRWH